MDRLVTLAFNYTLSEAWSGVNWADLIAAQGTFATDFYDRSTRMIVGTMLWTEYSLLGSKKVRLSDQLHPKQSEIFVETTGNGNSVE